MCNLFSELTFLNIRFDQTVWYQIKFRVNMPLLNCIHEVAECTYYGCKRPWWNSDRVGIKIN